MDAIDNLIFATLNSELTNSETISSRFLVDPFDGFVLADNSPVGSPQTIFNYRQEDKIEYVSFFDHCLIEEAIRKHWYDINGNILSGGQFKVGNARFAYNNDAGELVSNFISSSTYHMFYAFLVENTRIVQIFEKVIEKYVYDEELGVAPPEVRQWLLNTESLFFKDGGCRPDNIKSSIRPDVYKNRQNAYYRLCGTELAFGGGASVPFFKAKAANIELTALAEEYFSEVYYAYSHSRSTCCHSVDLNNLAEMAIDIRELFACRRGARPGGAVNAYAETALSVEEYHAVIMMNWFEFMIADNTPIVNFLGCQSSSAGDRLQKIGSKVGIQAHSQSQALLEMAGAVGNIFSIIETGTYLENTTNIQAMITSLNGGVQPGLDGVLMNAFLTVINNWEKATGHKLKIHDSKHGHHHHEVAEVVVLEATSVKKTRAFLN